jgi:hypothetical protein
VTAEARLSAAVLLFVVAGALFLAALSSPAPADRVCMILAMLAGIVGFALFTSVTRT